MKTLLPLVASAILLSACGGSDTSETEVPAASTPAAAVVEMTPVQRGAKVYAKCRACHTLEEDGINKVGPNLWGVYGAQAGAKDGFAYSKAMKASGVTWDDASMDAYLKRPSSYMPGNRMTFIGLKKQEDRDAVQAYLKEKTTP